jgi:hypothetical protein
MSKLTAYIAPVAGIAVIFEGDTPVHILKKGEPNKPGSAKGVHLLMLFQGSRLEPYPVEDGDEFPFPKLYSKLVDLYLRESSINRLFAFADQGLSAPLRDEIAKELNTDLADSATSDAVFLRFVQAEDLSMLCSQLVTLEPNRYNDFLHIGNLIVKLKNDPSR